MLEEENIPIEELISKTHHRKIQSDLESGFKEKRVFDDFSKNSSFNELLSQTEIAQNTAKEFLATSKTDRFWKSVYATILLIVLLGQIILLNFIFIEVGKNNLTYNESTFNIFITATLVEFIAVIKLVVKHLFHDNISSTFRNIYEQLSKKK